MSVSPTAVYVRELTGRLGIGVTLNPDGSVASVTGVEILRTVVDPNGVHAANAGSLALQTDGSVWVNTDSGTTWNNLGGGSCTCSTFDIEDDASGTWGTAAPGQVTSTYQPGPNQFIIQGAADAVGGPGLSTTKMMLVSGDISEGDSGVVGLATGDAANGASGGILLQTGTASGVRGNVVMLAPALDTTGQDTSFLLRDNAATALMIGSSGRLDLMTFNTTNGTEAVLFGASVLTNLAIGSRAVADGQINAGFFVRQNLPAGPGFIDVVLPARTGGWRVADSTIRAAGAGGGSVTVQTSGDVAVTDAMVAGNANVLTRAAQIIAAAENFAGGATLRFRSASGTPACDASVRIEPL